jgi:hypothetical protein
MSGQFSGACRFLRRGGWSAAAIALCYLVGGPTVGAAQSAAPANQFNDALLKLSPDQRAAKLADYLGAFCIGSKPFAMGVTKEGPSKGYAYWSLECAGAKSYAIQIAPDGRGTAIDCDDLKAQGQGRECYKAF